jgi:cation transport ATPase
LVKGDLQGIVKERIESCGNENINQNLFCFLYNVLGILIAAGFYILFLVFTFTDDCCIAMSFSSVSVIACTAIAKFEVVRR